jgi:regulator of replication initiation timing
VSDEERDKLGSRLAEQVGMTSTPPPDTTSPLAKRIRAENAEAELERLKALLAEHVAENLALHRECEQLRLKVAGLEAQLREMNARTPAEILQGLGMRWAPITFEQAWAEKEREGYQYGSDALEHVRFGWELARQKGKP